MVRNQYKKKLKVIIEGDGLIRIMKDVDLEFDNIGNKFIKIEMNKEIIKREKELIIFMK